jgi:diguanylate cyclase (GGDEF)-like protein/PAS domain S-box-containing protein
MIAITIPGMLILAGVCLYATFNHAALALHRPFDVTHLLFAAMSLSVFGFGLTHAATYQAQTASIYIAVLKWNISIILLFFVFFPWFVARFSGVRPQAWLVTSTALLIVAMVINVFQPYSLQYDAMIRLDTLHLPWGENVTLPVGHNGSGFWMASGLVVANVSYALYAFSLAWRRDRTGTSLAMLLAVALYLAMAIEGILVRASAIDFIHLGPYGFLTMVIIMSVALNRATRRRLRESEQRFRALVEQSPYSIQVLAPNGYTRQVNPAWERLWGAKSESLGAYNILEDRQLIDKGVMPYIEQGFAGSATEIPPVVYNPADNPLVRGSFRDRWVQASVYPIKDEAGAIRDVILMHQDVTDKKRVEDAVRLIAVGVSALTGEQFYQQLVLNLAKVLDADYAFIGMLDEGANECVQTIAVCDHGRIGHNLSYALAGTPCANVVGQSTCVYPNQVQRLFPEDLLLARMGVEGYIGTPFFDTTGKPLGLIVVLDGQPLHRVNLAKEILEIFAARAGAELQRQRAEAQIRHMAYRDYLTGLANRAQLHQRLAAALQRARRDGTGGALLLIDLDHFKTINDALGHDVGDEVLCAIAQRLGEIVAEEACVARLGGDEFVILLETNAPQALGLEATVRDLAQQLIERLASPLFVGERRFTVGASIGVAAFPENHGSELDILRHADMALYRAKNSGRGGFQFYEPSLEVAAARRLQLEAGLRQAMARQELELHYQPQVDADGGMIGAEVLLRWHHPELGNISPVEFIPVAEETGLIHEIGRWVLAQACARVVEWLQQGIPFVGHLSVNVCSWQFARPDFVDEVRQTLTEHALDPRRLMLELTETALLYDIAETIDKLGALRSLGLKVAMDDFGTGYSSLAYLRDLPLDQLKIDKAFVDELAGGVEHPLVESMVAIGQHMDLSVVAEGVETEEQLAKLAAMGCRAYQGYLFCHPLPEDKFLPWLRERDSQAGQGNDGA